MLSNEWGFLFILKFGIIGPVYSARDVPFLSASSDPTSLFSSSVRLRFGYWPILCLMVAVIAGGLLLAALLNAAS